MDRRAGRRARSEAAHAPGTRRIRRTIAFGAPRGVRLRGGRRRGEARGERSVREDGRAVASLGRASARAAERSGGEERRGGTGATRGAHLRDPRGRRRRSSPCSFSSSRGGALRTSDAEQAIRGSEVSRGKEGKNTKMWWRRRARERWVRETARERSRRVRETRFSISDERREDASRARTPGAGRAGPPRRRRHEWRSTAQTRIAGAGTHRLAPPWSPQPRRRTPPSCASVAS